MKITNVAEKPDAARLIFYSVLTGGQFNKVCFTLL
jgi:hypothetical protein